MWRSFVDRRYSPSTDMDHSEWEIVLDELIRMGYIVKRELDSDHNERQLRCLSRGGASTWFFFVMTSP
jgi:hypothetical protein